MVPSNFLNQEELVKQISKEFKFALKQTYLAKDDLKQEACIALILAQNRHSQNDLSYIIRKHISEVIKKTRVKEEYILNETPSNTKEPIDDMIQIESNNRLLLILQTLIEHCSLEQKIILKLRYGFLDGKYHDDHEISLIVNLPIKQIIKTANEALKSIQNTQGMYYLKTKFGY